MKERVGSINCFEQTKNSTNNFSKECIDEVDTIISSGRILGESNLNIRDLSYLKTYTIDNSNTYEIDDAISIDNKNGNNIIWIHISNPALYIEIDSCLDKEARRRSSSLYFVDSYISMFPEDLIQDKLSLKQGEERITLSISIIIGANGEIINSEICLGLISINYNLSYEDIDEILELSPKEEKEIVVIYKLLMLRRSYRTKNCPLVIEQNEGIISYINNILDLKVISKTRSRLLIEEAMILAGYIASKFAIKNSIPIPFRSQESSVISHLFHTENIYLRNFLLKKALNKAYISTLPSSHFTLALDSYVQITSPIRRYIDLLAHYQFLNFFRNKVLLDKSIISDYISEFNLNYSQVINQTRANKQEFKTKFIMQQDFKELSCIFLGWLNSKTNYCIIYILDYYFEYALNLKSNKKLTLGEEVKLIKTNHFNTSNRLEMLVN